MLGALTVLWCSSRYVSFVCPQVSLPSSSLTTLSFLFEWRSAALMALTASCWIFVSASRRTVSWALAAATCAPCHPVVNFVRRASTNGLPTGGGRGRPGRVAQLAMPHSGDPERYVPHGVEILGARRPLARKDRKPRRKNWSKIESFSSFQNMAPAGRLRRLHLALPTLSAAVAHGCACPGAMSLKKQGPRRPPARKNEEKLLRKTFRFVICVFLAFPSYAPHV